MTDSLASGASVAGGTRQVEFLEVLGRGGFGAVYLADVHGANGFVQRAAVKVLNTEMADLADIAARQRDEARLLARLQHHAIVRVFDLCELHGRPAVLMEYVEGVDCSALLKEGPLPARAALQVVATAASALDAAFNHAVDRGGTPLRVVHRDIKPANLLVSKHGGVKVLDFGVARGDFDREGRTESVQFGTARYMAPEQWLYGSVGHGVDIYALGVTLAELLAGQSLGRAPLQPEAFADHIDAAIAYVVRPEWPTAVRVEIGALLGGMLTYDPASRLSAAQVQDRAQGLADELAGESLPRYARRTVPALIDARREKMRQIPVLDATPVSYPAPPPDGTTIPDPAATPALHADRSEATLAEPGPRPPARGTFGTTGGHAPATDSIVRRAERLVGQGAPLAASLAETVPPPDDTGQQASPAPPGPAALAPLPDATERLDDRSSTIARQGRRLRARGVDALSDRVLLNDTDVDSTASLRGDQTRAATERMAAPTEQVAAPTELVAPSARAAQPTLPPPSATPPALPTLPPPDPSAPAVGSTKQVRLPQGAHASPTGATAHGGPPAPAAAPAPGAWAPRVAAGAAAALVAGLAMWVWAPWQSDPTALSSASTEPSAAVVAPVSAPTQPEPEPEAAPPAAAAPAPSPVESPAAAPAPRRARPAPARPAPEPVEPAPEPASEASSSEPEAEPDPVAEVPPPSTTAASAAEPEPEAPEPVATLPLSITSSPIGAEVFLDGARVGVARPGATFPVTEGTHELRLVHGDDVLTDSIRVSSLRRNRYHGNFADQTITVVH